MLPPNPRFLFLGVAVIMAYTLRFRRRLFELILPRLSAAFNMQSVLAQAALQLLSSSSPRVLRLLSIHKPCNSV